MQNTQATIKSILYLLAPTAYSILITGFLMLATITSNQFAEIRSVLQVPHDVDLMHMIMSGLNNTLTHLIGETRLETAVVGGFWAIVGLAVYAFLRSFAKVAMEFDEDVTARGYIWPKGSDRTHPLVVLAGKFAFRVVAILALIVVVTLPLAAVLRGPVLIGLVGSNKIVQYAVWFVVGLLVWHVVTVLLRLIALRARLLG